MTDSPTKDYARQALAEIAAIVDAVDQQQLDDLAHAINEAQGTVYFLGSGRSLLMLKAVSMRLMHIGLDIRVAGEIATPGISDGDLLVIASARGGASAKAAANTAAKVGAKTAFITSDSAHIADIPTETVLVIPARTSVQTVQHAGSLFEQSILVLGDALCRHIQTVRGVPKAVLDTRHANL